MVDFIKGFKAGQELAEDAKKNRIDIQSVFDDLNTQLAAEVDEKLKIEINEYYVNNTLADLVEIANFRKRKTYESIVAWNPIAKSSKKKLANWQMTRTGFPCRIYLGDAELICEDKMSLEANLQILLCDPIVGEILYKLKNLENYIETDNDELENDKGEEK